MSLEPDSPAEKLSRNRTLGAGISAPRALGYKVETIQSHTLSSRGTVVPPLWIPSRWGEFREAGCRSQHPILLMINASV